MDKKSLRRADLVMSFFLMLFSLGVFSESMKLMLRTFNLNNKSNAIWYRSAGLMPMIVSVLLAICALLLFLRARKDGARFDFLTRNHLKGFVTSKETKVASFVIGWLAFYIFVLLGPVENWVHGIIYAVPNIHWKIPRYLPYVMMTFIYLFVFMIVFNDRSKLKNWLISGALALCFSVTIAYLFGEVAAIILP